MQKKKNTCKPYPCFSYSNCPTVCVNKHFSCLSYGRVQTKGRNLVGTRNLRIVLNITRSKVKRCRDFY